MEKLKIPYPIVVEGKYDVMKLRRICDGLIIKTDGFGIFKRGELASLIRTLAAATPIIVLTDSDGGGRVIRSHVSALIPRERLIQLYIPRIEGKERRKSEPSREGYLGVEGMTDDFLYNLLLPMSENNENNSNTASRFEQISKNPLSKTDLYIDGLTGAEDSSKRRDELAEKLGLPCGMSSNALLAALKVITTYEEYLRLVGRGSGEAMTIDINTIDANGGFDDVF